MPVPTNQELSEKLDTLTNYIYNDSRTGRAGLVQKVDEMEKKIESLVHENNITRAKKAVWSTIWGGAGAGVLLLGKALITKLFS